MSDVLVTGGAGFIGSHLVDHLVENNEVLVIDNLSSGRKEFLNPKAELIEGSLLELDLEKVVGGVSTVFHLAATPEVRKLNPELHMNENFLATFRLLEAMRKMDVKKIVFASSSTVYGEAQIPTNENHSTIPISLYGASKLSSEAFISSYCHTFDFKGFIYRFANVIGPRLRHGVIYDFINKLREDEEKLEILGDGNQKKSYVYIDDCIKAMIRGLESKEKLNIFNIGTEYQITVTGIGEIVAEEMGLDPDFKYTGGERGWKGDVPDMLLSAERLTNLGWRPKYNSEEAVRKTAKSLLEEL